MAAKWTAALLMLSLAAAAAVAQDQQAEQPKTTTEEVEESASNAMNQVKESADSFASWVSSEFSSSTPPNPQGDQNLADKTKEAVSKSSEPINSAARDTSKDGADRTSRGLLDAKNHASEKTHEPKLAVLHRIGRSLRSARIMISQEDNKESMKDKSTGATYDELLDEVGLMAAAADNAGQMKDTTMDKAGEMMGIIIDKADQMKDIVSDKAGEIMDANTNKADEMTTHAAATDKDSELMDNDASYKVTYARRTVDDIIEENAEGKISNDNGASSNAKDTTTSNFEGESTMEKINEAMDRAARMIRGGKRTATNDMASSSSSLSSSLSSSSSNDVIRMATDKVSDAKTTLAEAMAGWKHRAFNNYKNARAKVKESLYEVVKERV